MDAALHIMSYLGNHHNSRLIFDPTYPNIDYDSFPECEWKEFYPGAEEPIPPDAPEPREDRSICECLLTVTTLATSLFDDPGQEC